MIYAPSRLLDKRVKSASRVVSKNHPELEFTQRLDREHVPGMVERYIEPDGGVFWLNAKPIVVPEAKWQDGSGNIDRWFKYEKLLYSVNDDLTLLTFINGLTSGEAAKVLAVSHGGDHPLYNMIMRGRPSTYVGVEVFSFDFIVEKIEEALSKY